MKYYIKWGFESRLKLARAEITNEFDYIKWGFESRLKRSLGCCSFFFIITNGDLRVD